MGASRFTDRWAFHQPNAKSSAAGDSSRTYSTQRLGRDRQLQHSLGGAARKEQNYSRPQSGERYSRHRLSHDQRRGNKAEGDALRAPVCAEHQRIELKKETVPNHTRNICVHLTISLRTNLKSCVARPAFAHSNNLVPRNKVPTPKSKSGRECAPTLV